MREKKVEESVIKILLGAKLTHLPKFPKSYQFFWFKEIQFFTTKGEMHSLREGIHLVIAKSNKN